MSFSPQNNASSTLAAAIVSTGATTFTVATGEGSRFGSGSIPVWIDSEAMLMTSRSGDVLTVTRAQEGTTAATHLIGATVSADVDKALLEGLRDDAVALAATYTDGAVAALGGGNAISPTFGTAITGAITLTSPDLNKWYLVSGTSANYTIGLPAISGNSGKWVGFIMAEQGVLTKLITLDPNGAETINGSATRILHAGEACLLFIDSVMYRKVGGRSVPFVCTMRLSAGQGSIPNATEVTILLDATDADPSGLVADTTNHRMVLPRTSLYNLNAAVQVDGGTAITAIRWIGSINRDPNTGTYATLYQAELSVFNGSYASALPIAFGVPLSANDKLNISVYQNSGGTASVYGNSVGAATHLSIEEAPDW